MKKKEIEKKINKAVSNSVPDVLDNILVKCEEVKGFERSMEVKKENEEIKVQKNKRPFATKLVGALAMAMICLCGVFGANQYNRTYAVDSVVGFDVNPSIEIKVNDKERVLDVIPLNEDGKKILDNMDFKNTDLNVATNAIVGSMLKNGFISAEANSILVSVKNKDAEKGNKLQERLSKDIEALLKSSSINASILSQSYNENDEIKRLAEENQLSEGKVELIRQVLKSDVKDAKGNAYNFETLSKLSINELKLLTESKQTKIENVRTTGNASESLYIGKEKAKQIAYGNAKVAAGNTTRNKVEIDYENGRMVYDVSFYVGATEYEYEIDAKTGQVISKDIEYDDNDRDDRDDKDDDRDDRDND